MGVAVVGIGVSGVETARPWVAVRWVKRRESRLVIFEMAAVWTTGVMWVERKI
jgi:hypothetical protein